MATCSECEVDVGDRLSCSECGANLVVSGLSPLQLELADEESAGDVAKPADEGGDDGRD
jgi:hypothetical protein